MSKKKILLIVNPISGTRSKDTLPAMLQEALGDREAELSVFRTSAPGEAAVEAARAAAEGFHTVICAGGDGTLNETASALRDTATRLGIIPCGSGNGLARSLGIPQDFRRAVEIATGENVVHCDHGLVNGLPFFCTFGLGFDAAVSEKFAAEKRRGRLTYIRSALLEYLSYSPQAYAIEVNGSIITEEAFLVAVCNTPQYGNNAYIAPSASLSDGLLDVTVVHSGNLFSTALAGAELMTGRIDRNTIVDTFRISAASISRLSEGPAQIDGEPLTLGKRLDIECRPSALRILAPAGERRFRPIISPFLAACQDLSDDIRYILSKK